MNFFITATLVFILTLLDFSWSHGMTKPLPGGLDIAHAAGQDGMETYQAAVQGIKHAAEGPIADAVKGAGKFMADGAKDVGKVLVGGAEDLGKVVVHGAEDLAKGILHFFHL